MQMPVYCVIIQSALEGGNHADWITLHLSELIVFPAGQIILHLGILFLSLLTFLKNLFCIFNYSLKYCSAH